MAATIIDAFVVTLGLDGTKFKQGAAAATSDSKKLSDGAVKSAKDTEAANKRLKDSIGGVRNELLGMFAVFTAGAGLKDFALQMINTDAATGRLAHNIGVATESLSAWQGVLKRNGGSAGDADGGLQSVTDAFEQIQLTGQSPLIPYLNLLKVNLNDLKSPTDTLLKLADAFSKMDPKRAAAIGKAMGLSPAMVNTLEKGRGAVTAMLAEQKKLGVTTEADAAASQRLQDAIAQIETALTRAVRILLTAATPALEMLGKVLIQLAQHRGLVVGAFIAIGVAAAALGIALALPILPYLALAAAVVAIGALVGSLVDDFGNLIKAMPGVGEAFKNTFAGIVGLIHGAHEAFDAFMKLIHGHGGGAARPAGRPTPVSSPTPVTGRPAPVSSAAPVASTPGGAEAAAAGLLRRREGFQATAKWDVNHYRLGYGSDTRTDARTGTVTTVRQGDKVSVADAEADLARRVREFMPKVAAAVGSTWGRLSDATKAVLTSLAYNYGGITRSVLHGVLEAARRGDVAGIAAAVEARAGDNAGVNRSRRIAEAAMVRQGAPVQLAALLTRPRAGMAVQGSQSVANDNRNQSTSTEVSIAQVDVHTNATDATGVAAGLNDAVRRRMMASQLGSGLT